MEKELKKFTKRKLMRFLKKIGSKLKDKVAVYMVGGGAMCLKDLKPLTRDLDIIIMTKKEFEIFKETLLGMDYEVNYAFDGEDLYREPFIVFRKGSARIDVFIKYIAGQLEFNKFMKDKSFLFKGYGNLILYIASDEDVFLSKCISDRLKDIEDCAALIDHGLDYKEIIKELKTQEKKELWRFWLYEQLCRIRNKTDRLTPLQDVIWRLVKDKWDHRPKSFMEDVPDERYTKELEKRKQKRIKL